MKFSLEIGEIEKHRVECESISRWEPFIIKVDDIERGRVKPARFGSVREAHSFEVGIHERLHLTIESVRGLFSGETHRVIVNGRLVKCFTGSSTEQPQAKETEAAPVAA